LTKWEYVTVNLGSETNNFKIPVKQALDKFGSEGWELVTVVSAYNEEMRGSGAGYRKDWQFVAYFKREKT
jgi:hypothetical protein